jgi:Gas vesicle protein K/Gas vesicle protein
LRDFAKDTGSRTLAYADTARWSERSREEVSLREVSSRNLSLVDLLDRILDKGIVINGDITVTVGNVELLSLKINLVIASLETAKRYGLKLPWEKGENKIVRRVNARNVTPTKGRWNWNLQSSKLSESPAPLPQALELLGQRGSNQNGLAKLVLSLVELLRQVLERQALRRVDSGELTVDEVERLGIAFLEMKRRIQDLSKDFGIQQKELDATFGSLIKTGNSVLDETSMVDLLDRCLKKGVFVGGQVKITVSDIELVGLDLFAMLYPVSSRRRRVNKW